MSLLPSPEAPRTEPTALPLREREIDVLDAMLVIAPVDAGPRDFAQLPQRERWQALHGQSAPSAGTVRWTTLANERQTWCALGYVARDATPFERLAVAGRMTRDLADRNAGTLALAALGPARDRAALLENLLAAALAAAFPLPAYRSPGKRRPQRLRRILVANGVRSELTAAETTARAGNLARWLTALPPNKLDARGYRRAITDLADAHGLSFRWLDEAWLRRAGAGAFLAVSAGNAERTAGIAHLRYRPRRHSGTADVALVGKGILFDTGGTNLKPHRSMLDMHTDMAGSAVALSTLIALAELRAPMAADAWLAITENRIGPTAYRPQDVIRASNGVTIQVIHTDAEGRMVLADTLALAGRTRPRLIVDFATLTGACVYALTERMSGVFTNRPALTETLVRAGTASGERVWPFPLDADFDADIESKVADVLQCAVDGKGDHILAARFLERFVPKDVAWAHLDLAAATRSGGLGHINTDVTGFGVRYTLELLLRQKILDSTTLHATA